MPGNKDMNLSTVRGYSEYAKFAEKAAEPAKLQTTGRNQVNDKRSLLADSQSPADTVSISSSARRLSNSFNPGQDTAERVTPQTTLKQYAAEASKLTGNMSQSVCGKMMTELLSSNGLSIEENETFDVNIDVWCAVSVTGRNAEKARAIQELLNSTPNGINWGLILQKLPIK